MPINEDEQQIGQYYDEWWPDLNKYGSVTDTLSIHYGYYEKGVKSHKQAVYNLNNFIGRLLKLDENKSKKILDAGCGIGGTSIYLAKKYPNTKFIGINIAPGQIELAENFAKQREIPNVEFKLHSFLNTPFKDNYFDSIFAVESLCHAEDYQIFLDEMYRILKSQGILVVIDGFLIKKINSPIMKKIYHDFCIGHGSFNFSNINEYKIYLQNKGFENIRIKNITKNISRSFLNSFVLWIPSFTVELIKKIAHIKKQAPKSKKDFYKASRQINAALLGLNGTIGYYATSAMKK